MIYFLKFGASFILPPGIFIVFFMVCAIFLWNKARRLAAVMMVATVVFYLLTMPLFADALLSTLENRHAPLNEVSGDVIIMLGGGATSDTPDLGGAVGNLSGSAANRLLLAARLEKLLDVPVILAGGQVYSDTGREAIIAKRMLIELGVDEGRILIDDQSLNTKQNAQNVHKLLAEHHFDRPILITSAFHMERSLLNFAKEGVAAVPFPADYQTNRNNDFYFNKLAPSAEAFKNSCIFFREWLGIFAAKLVK